MAERIREIRAVYDGKVFVPSEVIDLPKNTEVSLKLEVSDSPEPGRSKEALEKTFGMVDAPWFDPAKFDRGELYE